MKRFLSGFLLLIFTLLAFANADANTKPDSEMLKKALESAPSCANFVRFDNENIFLGFGWYRQGLENDRQAMPGSLRIIPLNRSEEAMNIVTMDSAIDALSDRGSLYVLTYSGIEEWSLQNKSRVAVHSTWTLSAGETFAYKQHPEAFARYGQHLIIAHGRKGVAFFDLKSKKLIRELPLLQSQLPLQSMATGVTVSGSYAYVVMDNFSLVAPGAIPPFRGLVVIDMERMEVVSEMAGLDPGADSVTTDGQKLVVSFAGIPIWEYSIRDLQGSALPEPEQRLWKFPIKGHPTGRATLDDKYYYTCYSQPPTNGGGVYQRVPLAVDRKTLGL